MLSNAVKHLINNVLPAAEDYYEAERALTVAFRTNPEPPAWEQAARMAKRRAAELAIAIDGLTDRCFQELKMTKTAVRNEISVRCHLPGTPIIRDGAHDRVRGVASAYKHQNLNDQTLPISSDEDILVVGAGFGVDGFGVGKFGGCVEVLIRERGGDTRKFLGDAPVAVAAWFSFLDSRGAALPPGPYFVCNVRVYP